MNVTNNTHDITSGFSTGLLTNCNASATCNGLLILQRSLVWAMGGTKSLVARWKFGETSGASPGPFQRITTPSILAKTRKRPDVIATAPFTTGEFITGRLQPKKSRSFMVLVLAT